MSQPFLMPQYVKEFSCIGGACEDTCCAGWKVIVDKKSYQAYKKVKEPKLKELLTKNISRERANPNDWNYAKIKMDDDGKCMFLSEEGWCQIHTSLGEKALCHTCKVYPRMPKQFIDRAEISLTPSCPEAARKMLLNAQGIDFLFEDTFMLSVPILSSVNTQDHPYFWELRSYTIRILQSRAQSVEIRLIVLGLFFNKFTSLSKQEQGTLLSELMDTYEQALYEPAQLQSLLNLPKNLSFQINMMRDLLNYRLTSGLGNQRYKDCLQMAIEGLALEKAEDLEQSIKFYEQNTIFYNTFMEKHSYILENYLVNAVFKDYFPLNYDTYFESYVMLIVNFSLLKLHLIGMSRSEDELTVEDTVKLIQSYSKEIEHNTEYLRSVRTVLKDSGYTTMAHMVVLLKS